MPLTKGGIRSLHQVVMYSVSLILLVSSLGRLAATTTVNKETYLDSVEIFLCLFVIWATRKLGRLEDT